MSLFLSRLQSNKFDKDGNFYIENTDISKYDLFVPQEIKKSSEFDVSTAIPVDTSLTRNDYIDLAKRELLNRSGFVTLDFRYFDEDEKRFGATSGEKVDRYYADMEQVEKEMKGWGETHLASMAEISLEHFNNSITKINYLKYRFPFAKTAFFFALIAYPVYLLLRSIAWAIKTSDLQKIFTVRIKKLIAKEVVILLGIILLGAILFKTGESGFKYFFKDYYWQEIVVPKKEYAVLSEQDKKEAHKQYENEFKPDISWSLKHRDPGTFFWSILVVLGKWILFLGYPVYWLGRFINWAVRILKSKE